MASPHESSRPASKGSRTRVVPCAGALAGLAGMCGMMVTGYGQVARVQAQVQQRGLPQVGARTVFPDEAIGAKESLVRSDELAASGNAGEAVRMLQSALEREAFQVVARADDPRLFEPVRDVVHRRLMEQAELRERYVAEYEPRARDVLDGGDVERVFTLYLMTPSGYEAALRLAQAQMERARFHAARMTLEQLTGHPVRRGEAGMAAARLLASVASFIGDAATQQRARQWSNDALATGAAGGEAGDKDPLAGDDAARTPPASARAGITPMQDVPMPSWDQIGGTPLQSITIRDAQEQAVEEWDQGWGRARAVVGDATGEAGRSGEGTPWSMPCALGDVVYFNDGRTVRALDAATLSELWRTQPAEGGRGQLNPGDEWRYMGMGVRALEDVAGVAVARGVVVAPMGRPSNGQRAPDSRVLGLDARTGALRWAIEPSWADERLRSTSVRGGVPVVEADVVVLGLRKPGLAQRVTTMYLAGIDLANGGVRWVRTLGSVGVQPWAASQERAEGTTLDRGVVYRADEMGIIGAYEATTGRTLWVRLTEPAVQETSPYAVGPATPSVFQIHAPVVIGDFVYAVEPGHKSVVQLRAGSGEFVSRLDARSAGSPEYLVRVGQWLAMVSADRVAFIPAGPRMDPAQVRRSVAYAGGLRGRCVAMSGGDGRWLLAVPQREALSLLDPVDPARAQDRPIAGGGNLVVGSHPMDGQEGAGALLVAQENVLRTYLSWDLAERGLQRRSELAPQDPTPVLTYLELALRVGRFELGPSLADRIMAMVREDPTSERMQWARGRLFVLLQRAVARWRTELGGQTHGTAGASGPRPADAGRADSATLEAIVRRMELAAEQPEEQVVALLDRAWLAELSQQGARAVEALQAILQDETLAQVVLDARALAPAEAADGTAAASGQREETMPADTGLALRGRTAWEEALDRLVGVVGEAGLGTYEPFEREAQAQLDVLLQGPGGNDPARLAMLGRHYPLAIASTRAWERAASLALAQGPGAAQRPLREGVRSALRSVSVGRDWDEARAGELLGMLVEHAGAGSRQGVLRLLLGVADTQPSGMIRRTDGTSTSLQDAAQELERGLVREGRVRPALGPVLDGDAQAIEGWEMVGTLLGEDAMAARDCVVVASPGSDRIALLGVGALTGRMEVVWSRPVALVPQVVRVTPRSTVLLWPMAGGAELEAISNTSGATLWRRAALEVTAGEGEPQGGSGLPTPLDGIVRSDDLILAFDAAAQRLVVSSRQGRMVCIGMGDGGVLWSSRAGGLDTVYDLELAHGLVLVTGAARTGNEVAPRVLALSSEDGTERWTVQEPVLGAHVRMARVLPALEGVGDGPRVLLGGERGLAMLSGMTGQAVWRATGRELRSPMGVWVLGSWAMVMDGELRLRRVSLIDGASEEGDIPLEDRVTIPFAAATVSSTIGVREPDTLALSSSMGLVLVRADGTVGGTDAVNSQGRLDPAIALDGGLLMIEAGDRAVGEEGQTLNSARVMTFDTSSARVIGDRRILLYETPSGVAALDGKLVIGQGPYLFVYDAPAE